MEVYSRCRDSILYDFNEIIRILQLRLQDYPDDILNIDVLNDLELELRHIRRIVLRPRNWSSSQCFIFSAISEKAQEFYLLLQSRDGFSGHGMGEAIFKFRESITSFRLQFCIWSLDSVLDKLQSLVRNFLRDDDHGLSMLKVELLLIKMFFFLCDKRNLAKQASLESSISKVISVIHENAEQLCSILLRLEKEDNFYPTLLRFEDGLMYSEFVKEISMFRESLKRYKEQICNLCTSISDMLLQSNTSPWLSCEFMVFFDSLLESLVDIIIWGETCDPTIGELIEPLQEQLIVLKNFIRFATLGSAKPQEFEKFLIPCQALAVKAARLCYLCWFYRGVDKVFHELRLESSELVQKIKNQVCHNYRKTLMSLRLSRSSFTLSMEVSDHMHIVGDFVDSLIGKIWEFLYSGTSLMVSLEHQLQILADGLKFLRTILKQQHEKFYCLDQQTKDVVVDMVYKAADISFQLYMLRREGGLAKEMNLQIFHLLEEIELIKAEVARKLPVVSVFNFPTPSELGFIDLILEKLTELAHCKVDSVSFADFGIQNVQKDLVSLRSFLEIIQEHHKHDEKLRALWSCALEVAYEAEFAIDSLIARDISPYSRMLFDTVAKGITLIGIEALEIDAKKYVFKTQKAAETSSHVPSQGTISPINDIVVGLDGEAKAIIDQLIRGSMELDIISIVGMPGLGKTTFAKKVYHDSSVIYHFHIRAWCSVSQVWGRKDVLFEILQSIAPEHSNQDYEKNEDDLAEKLRKCLKGNRYLIVLDDVWDIEAWNALESSFPDDAKGSRILLTGRHHLIIKPTVEPYHLRRLSDDECWELLQKKLVHKVDFSPSLCDIGRRIAKNCNGLPLSVVIIAGILADLEQVGWEEVAMSTNIVCGTEECMNILELSYRHLPNYLKPCLLYFGAFLEDQEIPIEKLMWLWMAEGFLPKNDLKSLEDTAEDCILALTNRNLVMVAKQGSLGTVKTCRIHDLLHEFCQVKSKELNFLHLIRGDEELFDFDEPHKLRRLCMYSQPTHIEKWRLFYPRIRSLLFFSCGAGNRIKSYNLSYIFRCKLLRVLDLGKINLGVIFPREITMLVQLRYLAVLGRMKDVPESIANLSNLETFLVTTNLSTLKGFSLPNTLWDMQRLRHLHVHGCLVDLGTDSLENSSNLDNLDSISTPKLYLGQSMEKIMQKFPNIRKLKCSVAESVESNVDSNNIAVINFPSRLESLKLILSNADLLHAEFNFPSSLRKLTLTYFSWSSISTIGKLPNLEVLKLFNGTLNVAGEWDMKEEEFPNLKILKLEYSDIVSWTSSGDQHFPCLQKLFLEGCRKLEELPSCLEKISTLDLIKVHRCVDYVGNLVREIENVHKSWGNEGLKIQITEELEEDLTSSQGYFYSSD